MKSVSLFANVKMIKLLACSLRIIEFVCILSSFTARLAVHISEKHYNTLFACHSIFFVYVFSFSMRSPYREKQHIYIYIHVSSLEACTTIVQSKRGRSSSLSLDYFSSLFLHPVFFLLQMEKKRNIRAIVNHKKYLHRCWIDPSLLIENRYSISQKKTKDFSFSKTKIILIR